jgi:hypothetical protein
VAVFVLFRAALQWLNHATQRRAVMSRFFSISGMIVAAIAIAIVANLALTRHDIHFDFTIEHVFTPDSIALEVVKKLTQPVRLTYFYRDDDPQGRRAQRIVELMSRENPLLEVTTVDPDKDPSIAQTAGVKFYNAALLEAGGRQIVVRSVDENEIALGIQTVLREHVVTVCFISGHGEYPSDNYEFHTHVEEIGGGQEGHSHGSASAIVRTTEHGVGRFKRSLEALGYDTKVIVPAISGAIDPNCRVVIDAGPQTAYSDIETQALRHYLQVGGAALLLYDLEFVVQPGLSQLLAEVGVTVTDTVVVDHEQHYAADAEKVAVTHYELHPSTTRLSFTFFPGIRALDVANPVKQVSVTPLFSSARTSVGQTLRRSTDDSHAHAHAQSRDSEAAQGLITGAQVLGIASEGKLTGDSAGRFKLIVVGDSDFVSNSFYPYMSNNRLALGMLRWLANEATNIPVAARIPAPAVVEFSRRHQRVIFLLLVVAMPSLLALIGLTVWWRRR